MDVHSPEIRSFNMSCIKNKNTQPEIIVRKWLWAKGYRYKLHLKNLPGRPDIVFNRQKKVIFINGCFWHMHKCSYFRWPKGNKTFWKKKIKENAKRDRKNIQELKEIGWKYLIIWECQLKEASNEKIWEHLETFLK